MSRLVEPKTSPYNLAAGTGTPKKKPDTLRDFGERVAKYVPSEILAFYTAAVSLIATADIKEHPDKRLWLFGLTGLFFLIATPLWLGQFSRDKNIKKTNRLMGSIAFGIWAYAFPTGWFHDMHFYDPIIAGLLLIAFTVVSAFVIPKKT